MQVEYILPFLAPMMMVCVWVGIWLSNRATHSVVCNKEKGEE